MVEETTDPVQKIDLLIGSIQAKMGQARGNTQISGDVNSLRQLKSLEEELLQLQRRKQDAEMQRNADRLAAEDEAYSAMRRQRNKLANAAEGTDTESSGGTLVTEGDSNLTMHFHGVTDPNEFVDKLETALGNRGVNRGSKKKRFFNRNDRTFDSQGG